MGNAHDTEKGAHFAALSDGDAVRNAFGTQVERENAFGIGKDIRGADLKQSHNFVTAVEAAPKARILDGET